MRITEYRGAVHRRCHPPIRAAVIHHSFTRDMGVFGTDDGAMPGRESCIPVPWLRLVGAPDSAGPLCGEASQTCHLLRPSS
jgi:hypothetical protein